MTNSPSGGGARNGDAVPPPGVTVDMEDQVNLSRAEFYRYAGGPSNVTGGKRHLLIALLEVTVLGVALSGCSPLPGASLDPVYLKLGDKPGLVSPQTVARPLEPVPPSSSEASSPTVWVGRYRDSRGEGEITFSFVQAGVMLSGTWMLRTGGGGPLNARVEADGRRLTFRMDSATSGCPGTFEGWAEVGEGTMIGAYHGKDCEGTVSDGRIDLRRK